MQVGCSGANLYSHLRQENHFVSGEGIFTQVCMATLNHYLKGDSTRPPQGLMKKRILGMASLKQS